MLTHFVNLMLPIKINLQMPALNLNLLQFIFLLPQFLERNMYQSTFLTTLNLNINLLI